MVATSPWQLEHESPPSRRSYDASRPQHHAIENDETGRWEATRFSDGDGHRRSRHRAGCVQVLDGDDCTKNHHPAVGRRRATGHPKNHHRSSCSCSDRAHRSTVTFILFTILLLLLHVASGHHDGYGFESNRDHVIPTETDDRDVGSSFGISPINYTLQFPSCGSASTFRPSVDQLRLFEGATESFLGSALSQVFPGGRGGFQQLELYANDYILWDENNRRRRKIEEEQGQTSNSKLRRRTQFRDDPPMVVTLLFSGNVKFRYTPPVDAVGEVAHVCDYMLTYHLHGLVDEIRRVFSNAVAQARVVGSSVDTNVCAPNNFGTTSSVMDVAPGSIPAGHGLGGDDGDGNSNEEGFGLNEMAPPPASGGGGNKRVPRPQGPTVNNDDGGGGSSRQPAGPETLAAESDADGDGGEPPSSPSMGMLLGIVGSAGAALALVSLGAVYFIRLRREEADETAAAAAALSNGDGSKKTRRRLEPMGGDGSTSSSVGDDLGMAEEDGDLGSFRNDSVNERNGAGYWDQVSTSLASGRGPRPEHERGDGGDGHPDGDFVSGGAENSEMQQQQQHPQQQNQKQQPTPTPQQQQQQPPSPQQQQQQQKLMERTIVGRIDDLDHPCDQRSTIPSVVSVPSVSASSSSSSSSEACSSKGWSSARSHDGSHDEEEECDDEGVQTSANDRPTSNYMYGASEEDAASCHSSSGSSGSAGRGCYDHDSWVATEDKMVVDDSVKIHNHQDRPQGDGRDSEDRCSVVTIEEIRQAKLPPATTAAEGSSVGRRPPPAPMYKSSSAGGVVTPPKAAKRVTVSEPAAPVRASSDSQICGPGAVFKTVVLGGSNKGKRGSENCDQSYGNTASMTTATSATDSFEENSRDRNSSVLRGPSFRWLRSKGGSRGRNHHHGTMDIEDDRLSMSAFSIGSHEDHHFTATRHPEEEARRRIMAVRDGSSRLMMINRSSSSEWEGGGDGRHHQRQRAQAQSQSRRGSSSSFLHPGRIRRVSIASSMSMASSSGDAAEDTLNKARSEILRYTHGDGDGGPRGPHAGPITEEDRALTRMMMARSRSRRTQRG